MDGVLVASLLCLALAAHLVPFLFLSPLPFNPDGFPLARISERIGATGSLWNLGAEADGYNEKMPVYSLLWSAVAQLGSLDVLSQLQAVMPLVTAMVVLPAYLIGVKATGHRVVGFASGLFVALFGSFLFLTSAAMKQAIGLLVLPMVVLLFQGRSDPRKRALAAVFLLVLPLIHHLTTLLALGMVSTLVVLDLGRSLARGTFSSRRLALDVFAGPALGLVAWAYYRSVGMRYLETLATVGAIALLLAIAVLLAATIAPARRPIRVGPGPRLGSPAGRVLIIPALALAALWWNGRTSVFAGAIGTQRALETILPAIAGLAVFALLGYQIVRRTANRTNDLVLAMLAPPIGLMMFGFLRGLDPLGQLIVYRTFDFMDYALALLAGIGFAAAWSRLRSSRAAQVALGAGFLAVLLATTPMAWDSEAVFGVTEVTTPAEFEALAVLASLHPESVTTDQRLAYVATSWFGLQVDSTLPALLASGRSVTGHDYAVVLDSWTAVGAQVHPAPRIVLDPAVVLTFLHANRVVYVAGPAGNQVYVVRLTGR